jgi:Pao retrotransposon peptidase.
MRKTIHEGYARLVPSSELLMEEQGFLPHHGVWKKNGSDVRVVFDSASKYRGKCLNDCLLTGPNLQNELFDVLVRFREHEIALTADIEAMFSRIRVKKEDAAYHRFLWRESSSEEVQVWEMTGVVFGDSCSPCIAINVLHQTVEDAGCEEEIQGKVQKQFYMDDYLDSFQTTEEALITAKKIQDVLAKGNFKLRAWQSNSSKVVGELGGEILNDVNLAQGHEEIKVLGLEWSPKRDCLAFTPTDASLIPTRRGLLSRLSGLFDPLGLCAPMIVGGKIKMKGLVLRAIEWDDPLDGETLDWWKAWWDGTTSTKELPHTKNSFTMEW